MDKFNQRIFKIKFIRGFKYGRFILNFGRFILNFDYFKP